ncbi:MAG: hypothetical protein R3C53_10145 [Pirellulaceae bacterium]
MRPSQPFFQCILLVSMMAVAAIIRPDASAAELLAGAAKVDITNREAGPVNDPLYAKALVLQSGQTRLVIVSLDVVAVGEIGHIPNSYLPSVRAALAKEMNLPPEHLLVNASHCHGVPCKDVDQLTVQVIQQAVARLTPVRVGVGVGHEDRIMENRRLKLKNGREIDVRHAYSMPADEEVAEIGPIDPQIGVIRLDSVAEPQRTVAVLYNFACHPIQGVPSGGNTADLTGFASQVIEDNLSEGAVALFLQGCGGDINPVRYKDVNQPRDGETLGNMLGLSTLRALRKIAPGDDTRLQIVAEKVALPRADTAHRIVALETEQQRLLMSLQGTTLNLKSFLPLIVRYQLDREFPSYYSHRYLHERELGRNDLARMDAENRKAMAAYMANIQVMEQLTQVQTNLALLKKHQLQNLEATSRMIDVEVLGIRLGEAALVTFPGELTVRIGLNIKAKSPHPRTFVSAYSNGYIYYAPTSDQLRNVGSAQEDSDCILAPEWQAIYEQSVEEILKRL